MRDPRLCGYPEQAVDKPHLTHRLTRVESNNLPLAYHIHGLNTLDRPLGGVEREVAETSSCPRVKSAGIVKGKGVR